MTAETRYMHTKNPLLLRGGNGWRRNLKTVKLLWRTLSAIIKKEWSF